MKYSVIDDSLVKISDIGIRDMQVFPPLTILMVVRSGILRRTLPIAILKNEATINQDLKAICLYDNSIVSYIFWVLKASEQSILEIYQKDGTTVESINFEIFKDMVIPIPPFSEQRRIVTAIETAFALIDEIEVNKTSLEKLIKQTKFKVIDLAIRGKIVKQHHEDEPVSALIGKIGNKKNVQKITADISHYPYDLPENWIWRLIAEISVSIQYGYTGTAISSGKYKMLRITDIQNNSVEWNSVPFVNIDDTKAENYLLHNNDIVFARTGATVGKSFLISHLEEKSIFASYLIRIRLKETLNAQYVKYFFESNYYWEQIENKSVGTGQPNVNGTLLSELKIPIPPIDEQQRIVTQIKGIFTHLDSIEKTIKAQIS
jgi:type I restriction enzyme S subunit